MRIADHDIGVCSWSLRVEGAAQLVEACRRAGVRHVHLDLGPWLGGSSEARKTAVEYLQREGFVVTAGMVSFPGENYASIASIRGSGGLVPDEPWPLRRQLAVDAGRLAAVCGIAAVSTHIGFIPSSADARYGMLVERVAEVCREYAAEGVALLMETGQERAVELLQFINDVRAENLAVNFDPANMILYGAGDPIEAVEVLGRHIRHVHVKDAVASDAPGVKWGREAVVGTGEVDFARLLDRLWDAGYAGPLVVEREDGEDRLADVIAAVAAIRKAAEAD